ncbi:MAG: hypothetical protein HKN21_05065, partial [Candidatus Eisenbacteria bacterium]|nr:hypothetical protein [Candidatus Eisenbacteria bacterium]
SEQFIDVQTAHNSADSITFVARDTQFEIMDLGREDIEEIGPVTFLKNGAGIVYTAHTTEFGTGMYSSALTPQTGQPNATLVTANVTLGEKIGILGDDEYLAWTSRRGDLLVARIFNPEDDGHINQIQDTGILRNGNTYGIAADENRLAYSVTESFEPEAAQLLWSETEDGFLTSTNTATTTLGRQPTWDPRQDINRLAWQLNGNILFAFIEGFAPSSPDTMKTEGFCQLPAWSPFGDRPVAYVQGPSETQAFEVRVQHIFSPHAVSIFPSLFDPRGLAWSPIQRVLAVAHNPGRGQVVLLFDLPIP